MMKLTEREYEMMMRFREAIDLFCDNGQWHVENGVTTFVIDEKTADLILILVDEDQEVPYDEE